jgi:hypothetical protein
MLLLLFVGLLLLRFAVRQLFALLFQLPPRFTRFEPDGCHPKSFVRMQPLVPTPCYLTAKNAKSAENRDRAVPEIPLAERSLQAYLRISNL